MRDEATTTGDQGNGLTKRISDAFDCVRNPPPSRFVDINGTANNNMRLKGSNCVASSGSSGTAPEGESDADAEIENATGNVQCPFMTAIDDYMRPSGSSGCLEAVTPTRRALTRSQLRSEFGFRLAALKGGYTLE